MARVVKLFDKQHSLNKTNSSPRQLIGQPYNDMWDNII